MRRTSRASRASRTATCAVVAAVAASAASAVGACGGDGPTAGRGVAADHLLFVSSRDAQSVPFIPVRGIYAMRATDGGDVRRLAPGVDSVSTAAVSPDGLTLAFSAGDGVRIYVGAAGGSTFRRLTTVDEAEWDPAWSPDGRTIAFACQPSGSEADALCVANADGTGYRVVHWAAVAGGRVFGAAWAPDGQRIAFEESPGIAGARIFVVGADGSGLAPLSAGPVDASPSWSPDGRRIAFASARDSGSAIYVMNADGTGVVRLTALGNRDQGPAWSPDGTRIAFASVRGDDGYPDVYVMRADGSGEVNLTRSPGVYDAYPSWLPRR